MVHFRIFLVDYSQLCIYFINHVISFCIKIKNMKNLIVGMTFKRNERRINARVKRQSGRMICQSFIDRVLGDIGSRRLSFDLYFWSHEFYSGKLFFYFRPFLKEAIAIFSYQCNLVILVGFSRSFN